MFIKRLQRRFRALVHRQRVEQELADELALHLELEQQKNERLGMPPVAARRAALVTFGASSDIRKRHATRVV